MLWENVLKFLKGRNFGHFVYFVVHHCQGGGVWMRSWQSGTVGSMCHTISFTRQIQSSKYTRNARKCSRYSREGHFVMSLEPFGYGQ